MKKCSIFIASVITLIIISNSLTFGQSSDTNDKFKFGVKGGLNLSSVQDDDRVPAEYITARIGFHLGIIGHYHLNDKWALQPELMYSKEGAKYDWPGDSRIGRYQGKTDLNLVKIPILVQYMFGPGFRIHTGPETGLIVNANFDPADDGAEIRKLDIQRINVAWTFGLGYLHKSGLGLDARYNLGLTNIYPSNEATREGEAAYFRVGQFGFFYQF